ncbi:MAG: DUF2065 domain-containing protein [Desulfomonilaceae bacterium]
MELFLCVIGMVMVVEGLPYFAFPEKMKSVMAVVQQQPDSALRVFGAALAVTGLVIVYLARNAVNL